MEFYDKTRPHAAYYAACPGANTLVVFIHGFFGSPSQFWKMSKLAYEQGCSVASLLLPGHGGTGKQFANSGAKYWQQYADRAIAAYALDYERLILVGHSMGGLLALNGCMNPQYHAVGCVTLNTPLGIRFTPRGTWNGLKVAFEKPNRQNEITKVYTQVNSVSYTSPPTYLRWIPRVVDLEKMIGSTKKGLEKITAPVLIIQSRYDETVQWRSGAKIAGGLVNAPHRLVLLKKSWHSYYETEEREQINQEFQHFIKHRLKGQEKV